MLRRRLLFFSALAVGAISIASSIDAKAPQAAGDDPAAEIESLLKERRDTFRQLVAVAEQGYRDGRTSLAAVTRASNSLLEAELDLATDRARRIALHERRVANMMQLEEMTTAQHRAARATLVEVLNAKAARLQAQIELLREQASEK